MPGTASKAAMTGVYMLANQEVIDDLVDPEFTFSGTRVLFADDNIVNQRMAGKILQKLKCEIDFVNNGDEAMEAISAQRYDVVFMDCQMPRLDGYGATRQLRAIEGDQRHTPIVAMTGSDSDQDVKQAVAAGMDDYIVKPVTFDAVFRAVNRWHDSQDRIDITDKIDTSF